MRTNTLLSLAFLTVATGGLAGCGEEPIPDHVSYERDIKPLMEARCTRCHGGGGVFFKDPTLPAWLIAKYGTDTPKASTDFTTLAGLTLYSGPASNALFKPLFLPAKADTTVTPPIPAVEYTMPPPPSPPLTTRERDMLFKWISVNPPNP